jgi:hypothetical protein
MRSNTTTAAAIASCVLGAGLSTTAQAQDDIWIGAGVGVWIEIPLVFEWHWTAVSVSTHHNVGVPWWLPDFHITADKDIIPGVTVGKAGIWVGDPPPFNLNVAAFDRDNLGVIDLVGYADINPTGMTDTIITDYLWDDGLVHISRDTNGDMMGDDTIFQGSLLAFEPSQHGLEELFTLHAPVPAPASAALLGLGGLAAVRRRR